MCFELRIRRFKEESADVCDETCVVVGLGKSRFKVFEIFQLGHALDDCTLKKSTNIQFEIKLLTKFGILKRLTLGPISCYFDHRFLASRHLEEQSEANLWFWCQLKRHTQQLMIGLEK